MADFTECAEIISRCMEYQEGAFIKAYEANVKTQVEEIIESSLVATCLAHWSHQNWPEDDQNLENDKHKVKIEVWAGTATVFLNLLESVAENLKINIKDKSWPKSPSSLSRRLNEIATSLKEVGMIIEFEISNRGKARIIKISKMSSSPSSPSSQQIHEEKSNKNDDDICDGINNDENMSSSNNNEDRAQSSNDDDIYDDDGITRTNKNNQENNKGRRKF